MSRITALSDLLNAVIDRSVRLVDWSGTGEGTIAIEALCARLMSSKGEASAVAIAAEVLSRVEALDDDGLAAFFAHLAHAYDPDPDAVRSAAEAYSATPNAETLKTLSRTAEPPRQELLRRLNVAPGATERLVRLRVALLDRIRAEPELRRIDNDMAHLLASWFNRGFLVLRPIDWNTPAAMLEKIIEYEAVHEIRSWRELRRRVEPADRRCFGFFHPSMPDEPLIFVQVALGNEVPSSIDSLLSEERTPAEPKSATVASFYSISNCQRGLAGVSFGAFLIKQVAADLAQSLPKLDTFVTLSPVPGLLEWVRSQAASEPEGAAATLLEQLTDGWAEDDEAQRTLKPQALSLAAQYLLDAKRSDGQPVDPVARFHLGNGAELANIHWMADRSERGMARSAGIMVNYHYRLDAIERNHEAYAAGQPVAAARVVRALKKG